MAFHRIVEAIKAETVRLLTAPASVGDDDGGIDLLVLEDSSADEFGAVQPSVESEDSDPMNRRFRPRVLQQFLAILPLKRYSPGVVLLSPPVARQD